MNNAGQHQAEAQARLPAYIGAVACAFATAYLLAYLSPLSALDFRHGFLWPLASLCLAAGLQYRFSSHRALILFSLIMGTCALALFGLWRSGLSNGQVLGGVLPFLDGGTYFHDTLNYLAKGHISFVSSRRPILTAYMTSLYLLTGQSYRLTLLMMTFVAGLSIFFAARSVGKTCGAWTELGMAFVLLLFYRAFVGTALTENVGFALGAIGYSCIWEANASSARRPYYWGLFFLALGLNARAGAFFSLPALALWSGTAFRGHTKYAADALVTSLAVIAAAFTFNYLLLFRLGTPAAGFSNFSFTLYGLLTGGDWTTFYKHYPSFANLVDAETVKAVYAACFRLMAADPGSLVRGIFRAWREMYFGVSGSYSFVWVNSVDMTPDLLRKASIVVISGLLNAATFACLGLLCLRKFRNRVTAGPLILASFAGVFFSVPFAPPWDANVMRVYAATIPFQVMVPLVGLNALAGGTRGTGSDVPAKSGQAWMLGVAITLLCLAPALGIGRGDPADALRNAASSATDRIRLNLRHAVSVHLGQEAQLLDPTSVALQTYQATQRDGRDGYLRSFVPDFAADLAACPAGTTLWLTIDQDREGILYLASGQGFTPPQGLFSLKLRNNADTSAPFELKHMDLSRIALLR